MLTKTLISVTGFLVYQKNPGISPYFAAFLIGILPIWGEVLVGRICKIEPARETSRTKLRFDALIDASCFLFLPCLWFTQWAVTPSFYLSCALTVFFFAGLYRLQRFLQNGLTKDGKFSGLPVTYTGYVWVFLVFLETSFEFPFAAGVLLLLSFLMLYSKLQIPASR